MDMVIVKGALNDRYGNNSTCIAFNIQDTVINDIIELIDWIILATFLLSGKSIISYATLLNRYIDINIFQERERVENFPYSILKFSWKRGQKPWIISAIRFHPAYMIVLWKMSSLLSLDLSPIFFNYGSPLSVFCGLRICTA